MNKFEKNIKDAVESYEAPYNAEAWQSLNKAMGPSKATLLKWITSSAALLALAIIGYVYFDTPETILNDTLVTEKIQDKEANVFIEKIEDTVYDTDGRLITKAHTSNDTDSKLITQHTTIAETTVESNIIETPSEIDTSPEDLRSNEISNIAIIKTKDLAQTNNSPDFKAIIITSKTTQCLSNEFMFTASIPDQNAIYEWHLGDETIATAKFVNYKYKTAGNYSVELVLRDLVTKDIISTSNPIEITVLEVPNTSFTYEESTTIEPFTYFKNTTQNYNSLLWEIENLKSSILNDFEYSFKQKGRYTVYLTATNEKGCSTTTSEVIDIEQSYNLLAPSAFSPNGDNLNDDFMPKALPLMQLPFTLTIYDRQGKLVYQTTDSSQPWDGLYTQDGTPAPDGVYVWVCQLTKENGETEVYQSQIIITK